MKFGFFAFAPGLPGAALFLLRISVAAALVQAVLREAVPLWLVAITVLVAVALALGVWTRVTACAAVAVSCWLLFGVREPLFDHLVSTALDAIALTLIGPGAFSVDAKRFGRRIVHLAE